VIRRAAIVAFTAALLAAGISDGQRWWTHVRYLASDRMEGRLTGSPGERRAAEYVAREFRKAGLKPVGTSGYFQPVHLRTRRLIEKDSSLELIRGGRAEKLTLGDDAILSARIDAAPLTEAPLVFAGYALSVPEQHHDDFAALDLRGKVAVYVSGAPREISGPLAAHAQSSAERTRALLQAGAVGTISIANPHHMDIPWARQALSRFQTAMSLADSGVDQNRGLRFAASFNPEKAEMLFAGSGHTFSEILADAEAGRALPRFPLPVTVRARVAVERGTAESRNVAAVLPGADPKLRGEYVVLSAHVDHLGIGEPIGGDRVYNGAMDDASGVATLLDIAETLHESAARPRRSLLFLAVTGEEKGLLGSHYFAAHPTVPRANIVADLNFDMFLPLYPLKYVMVYGLQESDLGDCLRDAAAKLGVGVLDDPEPQRNSFIRSDQYSFIRAGVPAITFKVGYLKGSHEEQVFKAWLKERYHAPSDDLQQPVDLHAAGAFNALVREFAVEVANRPERPQWKPASFFKRYAR
jgi:hypothetical protein